MKPLNLNFDPFPELTTERLRLRHLTRDDTADYFKIRSNETIMKHIGRPLAKTYDDVHLVIDRTIDTMKKQEGICWAICLKEDPRVIGTIGFYRSQMEHYRTEVGYELHPDFWKKGIMSEAMRAVLDYAFNVMNFHSVMANIDPKNTNSSNVLVRNNFIKEAHFVESHFQNGRFTDTGIYSLLKSRHLAMTGQL